MQFKNIKQKNKIINILSILNKSIDKNFSHRDIRIARERINGAIPKELSDEYGLTIERVRQIEQKVYRKSLHGARNIELQKLLVSLIKETFIFHERVISFENSEYWTDISLFCKREFVFYKYLLVEKETEKWVISKMQKNYISDEEKNFKILSKNIYFRMKYIKEDRFYKGYYFHKKDFFIKWYIEQNKVINIKSDLHEMKKILKVGKERNLLCLLERKSCLLKKSSSEFIEFNDEIKELTKDIYPKLKAIVEEKDIYKFKDIYRELISNDSYNYLLEKTPGQSLYYSIKQLYSNDFSFDTGRMMVIFPKNKKIIRLKDVLEDKYPKGFALVDFKFLKDKGFSKFVGVNTELIWSTIYFNEESQNLIKSDFERYFDRKKVLNHPEDIKDTATEQTKLYLKTSCNYSRVTGWFNDIRLISDTFINLDGELTNNEKKEELIEFLGEIALHTVYISEVLKVLENKKSHDKRSYVIVETLVKFNLIKAFLKYVYSNSKIIQENKNKIREILKTIKL